MRFVFWQNVVSIHQSAFIKALALRHEVTLVAAEKIDEQRLREKWNVPSMGNAIVIIAPSDAQIVNLISEKDVHHVFSGINAYPMVHRAFKHAAKKRLHVSIMVEPYEWIGAKGWLRRIMYASLYLRYGKNISHVFATGNIGVKCYIKSGFPPKKVHQWGYFTEQEKENVKLSKGHTRPSLIFIGKIDERKNILSLARCAIKISDKFERLTIIGTGPNETELREIIKDTPNIEFIGAIPNDEIASYLSDSDLLILPSRFDGWGAVVNEALAQGTRVLCSNHCGAETLLDGEKRGGIFLLENGNNMLEKLSYWIGKGILSEKERAEISLWASCHLSGDIAAQYFTNIIQGKNSNVPWISM